MATQFQWLAFSQHRLYLQCCCVRIKYLYSLQITNTSMNALNINSYHLRTKFLQPANLTTYTILSLFSLQVEFAPRLLLGHPHPYLPHYKSPTALSHMHHLTCGISSLLHSVNLILFIVLLSPHSVHITSSQSPPSLSSPITASTFHSRLKTHLFHKSFPPQSLLFLPD